MLHHILSTLWLLAPPISALMLQHVCIISTYMLVLALTLAWYIGCELGYTVGYWLGDTTHIWRSVTLPVLTVLYSRAYGSYQCACGLLVPRKGWCQATSFVFHLVSYSPPIDSIWALMLVWRISGKIMGTALCCAVYDTWAKAAGSSWIQLGVSVVTSGPSDPRSEQFAQIAAKIPKTSK